MRDGTELPDDSVLKIVIVGHVDHGKSSLVGRLLHDTGSLPEARVQAIRETCERRGIEFKWSFLMDSLQRERNEGITVDTAHIRFRTPRRGYVIIDAPGHEEFLKNMVTGAASSDAALLMIDAAEGVREQTRRHGYLLHLLGVEQVVVAVNKMDLIGYDRNRFDAIAAEIRGYLAGLGVSPRHVIPISAVAGDNIADRSPELPWYGGPTVVEALDGFSAPPARSELPLRLPVQDVYTDGGRPILVGRLESGRIRAGDEITLFPSRRTATVATIERWNPAANDDGAEAGQSIGITLGEPVEVRRGDVAADGAGAPRIARTVRARIFWMASAPMTAGARYTLRLNTARHQAQVAAIENVTNVATLEAGPGAHVGTNDIAEVVLISDTPVVVDPFGANPRTGRFVLQDDGAIVGGGVIVEAADADAAADTSAPIVWLTGLSGAGKSTIADALAERLDRRGFSASVLDGDVLRRGINADLGFSRQDRAESVRRTGEVAALISDAGVVAIAALISPYVLDRARVRALRPGRFHEVYVEADVDTCRARDPKGHYRKADAGEIPEFTGVSAPYEPPSSPEMVLDTRALTPDQCVDRLEGYVLTLLGRPREETATVNGG